ncbi:hypothetical protein Vretifemale_15344, partial [Volvox reticuliferus]
ASTVAATAGSGSPAPINRGGGIGGAGVASAAAAGGGGAERGGAGGVGSSSSILSLWRPDASSSWDDDPLLRMYVVHGGVDAQYVTYEHIEVYLHPLQVRLTYALAHVLTDYFELRDEEREEGGGKDEEGVKGAGRREKSKGSGIVKAAESGATAVGGAAAGGSGSMFTSPGKTGRSGGGGWFSRRSATTLPDNTGAAAGAAAQPIQSAVLGSGDIVPPATTGSAAAGTMHGGTSDPGQRMVMLTLADPTQKLHASPSSDQLAAATGAAGVAASPQHIQIQSQSTHANPYSAAGAIPPFTRVAAAAREQGRHSRGSSTVTDEHATAAVMPSGVATAAPSAAEGAAVAEAFPAATVMAVRYGPTFRRRSDGRVAMLVDVAGTLVPTVPRVTAAAGQQPSGATGRGGRLAGSGGEGASDTAATWQGTGGRGRGRAPRQLRFRHVRFNRMAARLTYTGPRLSIGGGAGWGLVIDARVYRNIVGGWKDILAKYKWDVIRSVIKSLAGIQAGKLKELQGVGGGSGAAAANLLLSGGGSEMGLGPGGLLAAGLSLEDLDPDITYTADGNALSVVAASAGAAGGGGTDGGNAPGAGGFGGGGQRAAALLGGVKKRAAAFMSVGGAAGARLRQVASGGRPGGRTTVGGGSNTQSACARGSLERVLVVSPEEAGMESEDPQGPERLEAADAVRKMVRQDTAQEYERIKRATVAAQARATRLAALLGDVPVALANTTGAGGSVGGVVGGPGGRGRAYRF